MPSPQSRPSLVVGLALALGLALGILIAGPARPSIVLAAGGDRAGESILASGPVDVSYHEGLKIQIAQDAIYFLDWKAGKLYATVPSPKKTGSANKIFGAMAERDLISDFEVEPGHAPHFLMTTAAVGSYDASGNRLFVFESTTRQVAVYSVQRQASSSGAVPKFELLERTTFGTPKNP